MHGSRHKLSLAYDMPCSLPSRPACRHPGHEAPSGSLAPSASWLPPIGCVPRPETNISCVPAGEGTGPSEPVSARWSSSQSPVSSL